MAKPVLMPKQGITVESCILTKWNVKVGDKVKVGDVLFSYETDKSAFDFPSEFDGEVLALFCEEGDEVPVLTNVCVIGNKGEDVSAFAPGGAKAPAATEVAAAPAQAAAQPAPAPQAAVKTDAKPVTMPKQGITVESCILTKWNVKVGDKVKVGDVLFSYETDKSAFDFQSEFEGEVLAIFCEEGDEVPVLTNVCVIGKKGDEYTLPKGKEFSTSLGVDANNDYMSNLGHVDFVEVDGEWWIAHWEWTVPFGTTPSFDIGRIYALSPMTWLDDSRVDYYVPVANGPTKHLQAKPYAASGYKNIAGEAKIEATNVQGDTLKYLTDGYTVTKSMYSDCVLQVKKKTEITLTFDSPKTVRGILIYNSYNYENAFSKIAAIQFDLAERPEWYTGGGKGLSCYIKDLGFPKAYKENEKILYSGVPSLATFNEIKVNGITITISDHLGNANTLNIAEIMVLGK